MRMLDGFLDLAARLAACRGATELDIRPAQRSLMLDDTLGDQAKRRGLAAQSAIELDGTRYRGITEADVRVVMEMLQREGEYPKMTSVEVVSAEGDPSREHGPHPGLFLADFGCHRVVRMLRPAGDTESWEQFDQSRPRIVHWDCLPALQELDRKLRGGVSDLVEAAMIVARLRGDADGERSDFAVAKRGAAETAEELWGATVRRLAGAKPGLLASVASRVAANCRRELDAKSGAYEGVWLALESSWAGEGELARAVQGAVSDRELQGLLWRLVVECANHRGDVKSARKALARFDAVLAGGLSLSLLHEALVIRNLACVTEQNLLPASDDAIADIMRGIRETSESLRLVAEEAGALLEAQDRLVPARSRESRSLPSHADRALEKELRTALGQSDPAWGAPDKERGRCIGTIARSRAFLGDIRGALDDAIKSRECFGTDSFDLRFNAAVLCRILLEQARCEPKALNGTALSLGMRLAGADALIDPQAALLAIAEHESARFTVDVILRAMLWAPSALVPTRIESWRAHLQEGSKSALFGVLSTGECRSHPSELVARHAGELTRGKARTEWLELSVSLCEGGAEGTVADFAHFTRMLLEAKPPAGPRGSLGNPCFEYR